MQLLYALQEQDYRFQTLVSLRPADICEIWLINYNLDKSDQCQGT